MRSYMLIVVLLFYCGKTYAQIVEWMNFTCTDYIKTVAIDRDTMWIGTTGGLVLLDKNTLAKKYLNKTNSWLPVNEITAIVIDKNGSKWIGTNMGGLIKYTNGIPIIYNRLNSILPTDQITTLHCDSKGNLWIGTYSGLVKYTEASNSWSLYTPSNSGLPDESIVAITSDTSGVVWVGVGMGKGIVRYNGISWKQYNNTNSPLPTGWVNTLAVDANGHLYVGTYQGMSVFTGSKWMNYNSSSSPIPSNVVLRIAIDNSNKKWIGTSLGVVVFDGTQWVVYNQSNSILPSKYVYSIAVDNSNNSVSVAFMGGCYTYKEAAWGYLSTTSSKLNYYGEDRIVVDKNGKLWVANEYGKVSRFNGNQWFSFEGDTILEKVKMIITLYCDVFNNIWLCTDIGGLKYDGTRWSIYNSSIVGLPTTEVRAVYVDKNGATYLASGGLLYYNGTNWNILTPSNSLLPTTSIDFICGDGSGTLWLGTSTQGIIKYQNSTFERITVANSSLPCDTITAMKVSPNGEVWVGTYRGIAIISGQTMTVFRPETAGIKNFIVTGIDFENTGIAWVSLKNEGIVRYDRITWTNFRERNSNLPTDYTSSIVVDKENNKWISCYGNGIAVYREGGVVLSIGAMSSSLPNEFLSLQNYPNPFNPTTTIQFTVPTRTFVTMKIYDILGREITTLVNERKEPGSYSIDWDAKELGSGVYFCRLQTELTCQTRKLLLIK